MPIQFLNADFSNSSHTHYFEKRIYLVPALRLNWYARGLKVFNMPRPR